MVKEKKQKKEIYLYNNIDDFNRKMILTIINIVSIINRGVYMPELKMEVIKFFKVFNELLLNKKIKEEEIKKIIFTLSFFIEDFILRVNIVKTLFELTEEEINYLSIVDTDKIAIKKNEFYELFEEDFFKNLSIKDDFITFIDKHIFTYEVLYDFIITDFVYDFDIN